jgi:hypothetical protein
LDRWRKGGCWRMGRGGRKRLWRCWCIEQFDEGNVKGIENSVSGRIPKAVSLGIRSVTDKEAWNGAIKYFGIMGGNKRERTASNFTEMRKRRFSFIPKLVRSLTIIGRGASEVGEICRCSDEFVPHVDGSVASRSHGTRFVKQCAVETLSTAVVCRCVGSSEQM